MRFTLTIDTDNAAFEADPLELQRCIKNVANRLGRSTDSGPVIDANGNTCGEWSLWPAPETCRHCDSPIRFSGMFWRDDSDDPGDGYLGDASCGARPILDGQMQPHEPTRETVDT